MGLKFSGTNYEDQNGIEKYIKDGTIIMSSELESTIAFMDEKHSEEFIKSAEIWQIRYGCLLFTRHRIFHC